MQKRLGLLSLLILLLVLPLGPARAEDTLDLSNRKFAVVEEIYSLIDQHPGVQTVDLTGVRMDITKCSALHQRYPDVYFIWRLSVYGKKTDSTKTSLNLYKCKIPSVEDLCRYLDCLPKLETLKMTTTTLTDGEMQTLRDRYPKLYILCNVRVGSHSVSTDATAFCTRHAYYSDRYTTEDLKALRWCTGLLALDVGHNAVTDISFLSNWPLLRVLILADNQITDLTPLKGLQHLEYLELFKNPITDITVLGEIPTLFDLNLTFCDIADATPLLKLPELKRLWFSENPFPVEQRALLKERFPHCRFNFTVTIAPTGEGWRRHPRYTVIQKMFNGNRYIPWGSSLNK